MKPQIGYVEEAFDAAREKFEEIVDQLCSPEVLEMSHGELEVLINDGSGIRTDAPNSSGGNINVEAIEKVIINESTITASAGGEDERDDSGNIMIDPIFLIL